jgi:cobalt-zinc-cadmium efflux system outer membrane protein
MRWSCFHFAVAAAFSLSGLGVAQENNAASLRRLPPVEVLPPTQGKRGLTLADVEALALRHNPTVARALADVQAAEGNRRQVGLYPNPILGLGEQQTGSRGIAEQDGVSVQQDFVTGQKLRLNREVAGREVAWYRQQYEAQRLRVLTDVRSEFFNVALGERQRDVSQQLVKIAQLGVDAAKGRNKGDEIGRNDVVEAQVELYNAEIAAQRGATRAIMSRQRLAAAAGVHELVQAELNADLESLPPERDFEQTLLILQSSSPEVAAALAEVERAQWALRRAGVEKIPNVTVMGLYNWRDNGVLGGKPDGAFQVALPVPVFNRNQGGVQRAMAELVGAQRAVRQAELSLQDRLADSFETFANARMQVQKYRHDILPAAHQALELTRAAYAKGNVEYDDLLTSQRTNANANLEYLKALKELRTSEMEIEGLLLSGSLDRTPP